MSRQHRTAAHRRGAAYQVTGSALAAALARIDAAFGEAAVINAFKIRVERWLRLGAGHPATEARFGARAALLAGRSLDEAIAIVECWWRDQRKAFQIASALGCGTRLSLEVLRELRLLLRLMRRKQMHAEFHAAIAALPDGGLGTEPAVMAAE